MRIVRGWTLLSVALVVAGRVARPSSVAVTPASDVAAIRAVFDTTAAGWIAGIYS